MFLWILFFTTSAFSLTNRYNHHWVSFPLWHSHFILSEVISNCPLLFLSILDTMLPHLQQGSHLQVSYHFAFSYCSWGSLGKNPGTSCHFLLQCMKVKSEREVVQSCPTPSNPMDCSPPDSSAHGILQARILEWGAIALSGTYFLTKHKF